MCLLLKFFIFASLTMTINTLRRDAGICDTPQCIDIAEMFKRHMDPTSLPCNNFYNFMCGKFHKANPLRSGRSKESSFSIREQYVDKKILEFLEDNEYSAVRSIQKTRDFFKTCVDEAAIKRMGEPVVPIELNSIGLPIKPPFNAALDRAYDFSRLLAKVHRRSVFTKFLFDVSISSDESNLKKQCIHFDHTPMIYQFRTNDEYLQESEPLTFHQQLEDDDDIFRKKKDGRGIMKEYMKKILNYMNQLTYTQPPAKANEIIEARIAKVINFLADLQETKKLENPAADGKFGRVTKVTVAQLQKITDEILEEEVAEVKINWLDYFETLFEGISKDTRKALEEGEPILIKHMQQFKETIRAISKAIEIAISVCTLWWTVIQSVSHLASAELYRIHRDYYTELLIDNYTPPAREIRCLQAAKNNFSHVLGFALVFAEENPMDDRDKVNEMVFLMKDAFEETITQSTWLDSSTKMAAITKLRYISQLISYQNWLMNPFVIEMMYYDRIVISGHYYSTLKLNWQKKRGRLLSLWRKEMVFNSKQVILTGGNPIDVNAGYVPEYNFIEIPLGILGPPFYGLGLEALNFGAMGTVMAHELGHAFDIKGKNYNAWGQKRAWWKKQTDLEYERRTQCFERSYSEINIPSVNRKVNGKLTLNENIADFIGFTQSLKAYRKYVAKHGKEKHLPHFEQYSHEKLFTMAFANIYCETMTPLYTIYQMEKDEHSPGQARILGVLKNSKDFSEIWDCPDSWEMNPKEKCELW